MGTALDLRLGEHTPAVADRLARWSGDDVAARLWARDHTLWFPEARPELTDRLGWLALPERFSAQLGSLVEFGEEIAAVEFRDAIVLGMGGSSLAPEVYAATFGSAPDRPRLRVLDSTHPAAVTALAATIDPARTLFIVSSKSGTTLETLSFFRYFWSLVSKSEPEPGANFVAVTDEGSDLATLAAERGFRRLFIAPSDVGGRYSALTEFGLVPAAVIGVDLAALADGAIAAATDSRPAIDAWSNPGLQLGAALGELAVAGIDKLTLVPGEGLEALPAWVEQLVAESTGKNGRGIVPIGGEDPGLPGAYGVDRFFLAISGPDDPVTDVLGVLENAGHPVAHLTLQRPTDLGGAMFVLETAVAMAGSILGIHPFNQPDVQVAKDLARAAMAGELDTGGVHEIDAHDPDLADHIGSWLAALAPGDYVGIQAFVAPTKRARSVLAKARHEIRDHRRVATTLDFGPRFLHSTGQLHKGGPESGAFLQIVDHPARDVSVPETSFDFGALVTAQALGDHQALRERGRRLVMVCTGDDPDGGLDAIAEAVATALR
ncbi:MAG: glucose-6-phosphate isomerase [Acidimicrobiia bacterium]